LDHIVGVAQIVKQALFDSRLVLTQQACFVLSTFLIRVYKAAFMPRLGRQGIMPYMEGYEKLSRGSFDAVAPGSAGKRNL
jgi:hypothetical protein